MCIQSLILTILKMLKTKPNLVTILFIIQMQLPTRMQLVRHRMRLTIIHRHMIQNQTVSQELTVCKVLQVIQTTMLRVRAMERPAAVMEHQVIATDHQDHLLIIHRRLTAHQLTANHPPTVHQHPTTLQQPSFTKCQQCPKRRNHHTASGSWRNS